MTRDLDSECCHYLLSNWGCFSPLVKNGDAKICIFFLPWFEKHSLFSLAGGISNLGEMTTLGFTCILFSAADEIWSAGTCICAVQRPLLRVWTLRPFSSFHTWLSFLIGRIWLRDMSDWFEWWSSSEPQHWTAAPLWTPGLTLLSQYIPNHVV